MSFGINGPDNIPAIQKAQNMFNNGGGGNLGYFQQNRKKKDEAKAEQDILDLSFKQNGEEEDNNEFSLNEIGSKIKNFWMLLHSDKSSEKKEENQNIDDNSE